MSRSAGEQERDVAAFRDLQKVGAEEGEVDHTQHAGPRRRDLQDCSYTRRQRHISNRKPPNRKGAQSTPSVLRPSYPISFTTRKAHRASAKS
jgi:hypothetical protein